MDLLNEKMDFVVSIVGNQFGQHNKPDNFPKIPCSTLVQFQEWEKFLEKNLNFNFSKFYLRHEAIGDTVGGCVRNLMKNILTNRFAEDFNWEGKKKVPFKNTNSVNLICSLLRDKFEDVDKEIIKSKIQDWLKHSKKRK